MIPRGVYHNKYVGIFLKIFPLKTVYTIPFKGDIKVLVQSTDQLL